MVDCFLLCCFVHVNEMKAFVSFQGDFENAAKFKVCDLKGRYAEMVDRHFI